MFCRLNSLIPCLVVRLQADTANIDVWTVEEVDELICLINSNSILYDMSLPGYSNRDVKDDLWRKVSSRISNKNGKRQPTTNVNEANFGNSEAGVLPGTYYLQSDGGMIPSPVNSENSDPQIENCSVHLSEETEELDVTLVQEEAPEPAKEYAKKKSRDSMDQAFEQYLTFVKKMEQDIVYVCNVCNFSSANHTVVEEHMQSHSFTSDFSALQGVSARFVEHNVHVVNYNDKAPEPASLQSAEKIWCKGNVLMLIDAYKQHEAQFATTIKKVVWQKIANVLSEKANVTITTQQCDTKWKDEHQQSCPSSPSSSVEEEPECSSRKRKRRLNLVEQKHKEKMQRQDRYLDLLERLTVAIEKRNT
ncbi:hypothetical protein FQA39_LY16820 [Lamprigera yunnana]|nr:hypothetical protein FQA39_LY16820 [Lamprigera yunnana]